MYIGFVMSDTNEKTNEKSDWQKREIGALWKNEGRNQKYLSGHVKLEDGSEQKVVVFSNKHRNENDRAPHFRIYKSKEMAQEEGSGSTSQSNDSTSSGAEMEEGDLL